MQTIQYRNHETFEDNEFLKSMELLLRLYVSKIEINSMVIAWNIFCLITDESL
jgi:hypothetical protein